MNLKYENKNGYENLNEKTKKEAFDFCEKYKVFLDNGKTERECVSYFIKELEQNGFLPLDSFKSLKSGDKVYKQNRNKGLFISIIGEKGLEEGLNIIGAHIDVPRIDIKQNPLYEENSLSFLKTHYYGGIKKYQWTAIPLALHGILILQNGEKVIVNIGEDENDPVFCITDLLPHLAESQMNSNLKDAIKGEGLNILIGSIPTDENDEKEKVKKNILNIIFEKYKAVEEDFLSAELCVVPAFKAKDVGIDRGLVGAYGHDDRVCSFSAFEAICSLKKPSKTAVCLLVDKEEIGSMGNTGMQSKFFEYTVEQLCELTNSKKRIVLSNSACISADVGAAVDPFYKDVQDLKNAPYINFGVLVTKYTGSRGKSGTSDANAEFVAKIRKILNDNNIAWQTGELGKVDMGGGGTIAQFIANLNIDVIDMGVPLLSMHSPFEIAGKLDIFMTYRAYFEFYRA